MSAFDPKRKVFATTHIGLTLRGDLHEAAMPYCFVALHRANEPAPLVVVAPHEIHPAYVANDMAAQMALGSVTVIFAGDFVRRLYCRASLRCYFSLK